MSDFILSVPFCMHNKVCILSQNDETVRFGVSDLENRNLLDSISRSVSRFDSLECGAKKRKCEFELLEPYEYLRVIKKQLSEKQSESLAYEDSAVFKSDTGGEEDANFDSPAVNMLDSLVMEAVASDASDIHLEAAEENAYKVRFRVDGKLVEHRQVSSYLMKAVIRRIKLLAGLQSALVHLPQDGRFLWQPPENDADNGEAASAQSEDVLEHTGSVHASFARVDIRVSCMPCWNGESVVMRIFCRGKTAPQLEKLGFRKKHLSVLKKLVTKQCGLVLVCGATGSGKTTTLAALLSEAAKTSVPGGRKIITIEDPVEYCLSGITQIGVNPAQGFDFSDALRSVFRQDPDVLMIGEIRDEKTAETAIRAALTGHLVFATLHTQDACSAVFRLLDMNIPPYLISAVLLASVAQRLVDKVQGGRTVVAEILEVSGTIANLIEENCSLRRLRQTMALEKMDDFETDVRAKKSMGIISEGACCA